MACATGGGGGALLRFWLRRSDAPKFAQTRVATPRTFSHTPTLVLFRPNSCVWLVGYPTYAPPVD